MSEKPASRGIAFSSMSMETGRWDVSAFSSYASICVDILISCGPRFSSSGDTVNLSRCFYSPAILTLCVNPQRSNTPMQKVMLIGNLGRDPEVKYSQQGTAIAQFSVATTERWKDKGGEPQEHTEWFAVKAFGRLAEIVGENLHKGARVYVEGRKRTESWDDKQTGAKHYRDLVYADRI